MSRGRPPAQFEATLARLRADVRGGRYATTGLLPGERDLAVALAVSRTTVRRALTTLVVEGVLTHRQGVGTFVPSVAAGPPEQTPPAAIGGFTAAMRRLGREPSTRVLDRSIVAPTAEQAMLLASSSRDRLIRVRRLRCADGEPVMSEEVLLPERFSPEGAAFAGSLYAALAARGVKPVRALQRVQAGLATPGDAGLLEVATASPLVLLRRVDYLADGRCCLLTDARVRPDRIDLLMEFGTLPPPPATPIGNALGGSAAG